MAMSLSEMCEWSANHKFKDMQVRELFDVWKKYLKLYFTACEQHNHEVYPPAEEAITNRLIPKLEQLVIADTRIGGKHEMYRKWHQNSIYFWIDNRVVCNYQAAKGQIARELSCPIEKPCDLETEGEKILEMIDDLQKISVREFLDKHNPPIPVNGLGEFLEETTANVSVDDVSQVFYCPVQAGDTSVSCLMDIDLTDNASLLSLYSFVAANPEYFGYNRVSLVDNKFNYLDRYDEIFVPNNVRVEVTLTRELSREDYAAESLMIQGRDEEFPDIVIYIKEENDSDFANHLIKLAQFYNEQVYPFHFDEEAKKIERINGLKEKKQEAVVER